MFRSLTFSRFVSFLMIPAVTVLAGILINPPIARALLIMSATIEC